MSNFLKSELYKLTHRVYPYVLLVLGIILAVIINWTVFYGQRMLHIGGYDITGSDMLYAGLYMMASIIWYMMIFTTDIGFSGEWRNNTMKNTVSFGTNRNVIFFGKCIINFLILIFGTLIITGVYILSNYLMFKNDGSLTSDVYSTFFTRFLLMLPLIFAGQAMASALCLFFSTDLLWCGIYAVIVALLPNGIMLFYALFPDNEAIRTVYNYMPTICLQRISYVGFELTKDLISRSFVIAIAILIIFVPISLIVFNRKEIK